MKPLTKFTLSLFSLLLASGANAADSADSGQLHFSLSVQPVLSDNLILSPSEPHLLVGRRLSLATGGLKVDTALMAGSVTGGVTFLQGDALPGDSFSSWYKTSPKSDLGLQPVFILPSEYLDSYTTLNASADRSIKAEGIALHGGYEFSPNLQINGAFLVAKSQQLTTVDELAVTTEKTNWQLNLGGAYKFKDNLVYSVNFGYLDGVDVFKKENAELSQGHAYVIKHQLNMSF
jgi:hypothetical protein